MHFIFGWGTDRSYALKWLITKIESLGADSLDLMDMVMNFEDEFGVEIDADSMGTLKTIGDVVDYLTAHQN